MDSWTRGLVEIAHHWTGHILSSFYIFYTRLLFDNTSFFHPPRPRRHMSALAASSSDSAGESKASSTVGVVASQSRSEDIEEFFRKTIFRSDTETSQQLYQIRVDSRSSSSAPSSTPRNLLKFAVYAFDAEHADGGEADDTSTCGGEITLSTLQIGSSALSTILLSGDLSPIGLSKTACGTLDMEGEKITWSNGGGSWIVHARALESNSIEAMVGTGVSDLDSLSSAQLKVAMLFSEFDKDGDGILSFPEFQALDAATEDEPQEMTTETFAQIVRIVHSVARQMEGGADLERDNAGNIVAEQLGEDVQGMDLADLTFIYMGPVAETFGTDLNGDFAAIFPTAAKVAMIFDTFDADQDGFWNQEEMCEFMSGMEKEVALEWYRSAAADGWIQLKSENGAEERLRLTLGDLLRLYIPGESNSGTDIVNGIQDPPLSADLEEDFEVCGERILMNEQ